MKIIIIKAFYIKYYDQILIYKPMNNTLNKNTDYIKCKIKNLTKNKFVFTPCILVLH